MCKKQITCRGCMSQRSMCAAEIAIELSHSQPASAFTVMHMVIRRAGGEDSGHFFYIFGCGPTRWAGYSWTGNESIPCNSSFN